MHITELNNAFRALESMIAEAVSVQKVDTATRDALMTAAGALDRELSRKLVAVDVPEALAQYQAGMITLNEFGQQFLRAYGK